VLSAVLLGTVVWMLYDLAWLATTRTRRSVWIILIMLGMILGIGLSWSLIRQRATGQVECQLTDVRFPDKIVLR